VHKLKVAGTCPCELVKPTESAEPGMSGTSVSGHLTIIIRFHQIVDEDVVFFLRIGSFGPFS